MIFEKLKKLNSLKFAETIFDQCPTYVETRQLVITSKMFEKHQWKGDIVSKDESDIHKIN